MTVIWVILIGLGGLLVGFVAGFMYRERQTIDEMEGLRYEADHNEADRLKAESDLRLLQNNINATVEERLEEKIAEWWPTKETVEDEWKRAERMALKRQTIEGGRLYPPVVSEGEPSRVSEITFTNAPYNPADPI